MKHNVKFYIEKRKDKHGKLITDRAPLFADIRFAGTRMFYFTGYRIDADPETGSWNYSDGLVKKKCSGYEGNREVESDVINRRIKLLRATLTLFFDSTQTVPTKSLISQTLDKVCKKAEPVGQEIESDEEPFGFLQMFKDYVANARLSEGRKKHAMSTLKHWERFAEAKKLTLTFESITPDVLRAFEKFLISEKKLIKDSEGKKEKKAIRGMNTLHSIFALTRTFWNHARKELKTKGIVIQYPFESYKVPSEVYGTPIYLTLEERNKLYNAVIKTERLAKVRDIFVFQCMVGARVGDLCRMTKSNISNNVLSYIQHKTKEGKPVTVTVPLSARAIEILSRYDMPDGRLMPFITDQKYNDYLKDLFKEVGLTRSVTRQHPTTREQENVRLCDIASSHMARRSFVGNMFGKVDSAIIASMSGHVANSKSFTRYHDVSKELQQQAIKLLD